MTGPGIRHEEVEASLHVTSGSVKSGYNHTVCFLISKVFNQDSDFDYYRNACNLIIIFGSY
jgi:hypothetical protein